jgi:hypothetical protein
MVRVRFFQIWSQVHAILHSVFALSSIIPVFCTVRAYILPVEAHVEPQPEEQHRNPLTFSSVAIPNDEDLYI